MHRFPALEASDQVVPCWIYVVAAVACAHTSCYGSGDAEGSSETLACKSPELKHNAIVALTARANLEAFQMYATIFKGNMSSNATFFCVGLGSIEIRQDGICRKQRRANQVLTPDSLVHRDRPVKMVALERTIIIRVHSPDLSLVCGEHRCPGATLSTPVTTLTTACQPPRLVKQVDTALVLPGEASAHDLDLEAPPLDACTFRVCVPPARLSPARSC